jgi:hypothetical protein
MEFLYKDKFTELNLTDCPPKYYEPKEMEEVFRWVFDEIGDERNFIAQIEKQPKRFLAKDNKMKCAALALSMFDSLENALSYFGFLKKIMKEDPYLVLGTKVAAGKIGMEDGVNGTIDTKGHFNHHPIKEHNYDKRFQIIQSL